MQAACACIHARLLFVSWPFAFRRARRSVGQYARMAAGAPRSTSWCSLHARVQAGRFEPCSFHAWGRSTRHRPRGQTFWSASVVQAHAMHTGAAQGIGVRCGRVSWHIHAIPPRCLGSVAGERPPPTHPSSTPLPRLSASILVTCPLHSLAVSLSNGGLFHGRFQKTQQGCKHGTRRRRSRRRVLCAASAAAVF